MQHARPVDTPSIFQFLWTHDGRALAPESLALWQRFTGQRKPAGHPWGWLASVHPQDRQRVHHQWEEAGRHAHLFATQYRLHLADGGEPLVQMLCVPLFSQTQTPDGWVSWVRLEEELPAPATPTHPPALPVFNGPATWAPVGMACLSLDRRFIAANERYAQIVGAPAQALIGQRQQAMLSADAQLITNLNSRQMLIGNLQHLVYETAYARSDGETLWLQVTSTLVWHPHGFPLYFFCWLEDLSPQRRSEHERRVLAAREQAAQAVAWQERAQARSLGTMLHALLQSVTEGVIVYDRDERVRQINDAARTLLDLGPEADCLGKTYAELFGRYERYTEAMEPLLVDQLPLRRLAQGQAVSPVRIPHLLVRSPSGKEHYFDLTWTPLHDPQGCPMGLVTILRDVTARHQQEQRIRRAFALLSSLLEAMVQLPLSSDQPDTCACLASLSLPAVGSRLCELIRQMLPCAMVGLAMVEGPLAQLHLVGLSGFPQELAAQFQQVMEHATLAEYLEAETIARLQANQVVVRELDAQPFVRHCPYGMQHLLLAPMLLEGKLVGLFGIDRPKAQGYAQEDIDLVKGLASMAALVLERVRLLQAWAQTRASALALQETNRRFDLFLSLASHELRTPLTGIRGCIQLVLRRLQRLLQHEGTPQVTEATVQRLRLPLEDAIGRATTQERLIADLLDASRIQANQFDMLLRPVNLVDIVRQATQDLRSQVPERSIALDAPVREAIPVLADADRIGQVVSNYLGNAVKYSGADHPITLGLTQEGGSARVWVTDQGPGLTPQEQLQIWERFHRVSGIEVQYGTGAGLGLGLSLCRTIIERHGGQVGVQSRKGHGSTFWFSLPLLAERSSPGPASSDPIAKARGLSQAPKS